MIWPGFKPGTFKYKSRILPLHQTVWNNAKKKGNVRNLGIQHATGMRHTVICDLSGSTIFSHIIS
jgi:hypothetical protein